MRGRVNIRVPLSHSPIRLTLTLMSIDTKHNCLHLVLLCCFSMFRLHSLLFSLRGHNLLLDPLFAMLNSNIKEERKNALSLLDITRRASPLVYNHP